MIPRDGWVTAELPSDPADGKLRPATQGTFGEPDLAASVRLGPRIMAPARSRQSAHARLGLPAQMRSVTRTLRRMESAAAPDDVHRLRVALRRCRSFATLMEDVDPHPAWAEMKELSRRLFRRLGALRDVHVLDRLVRKLTSPGDPVRDALLPTLKRRERKARARVRRATGRFEGRAWRRSRRRLERRVRAVLPDSGAARRPLRERYEDVRRLHVEAMRTNRTEARHELRVALKRFRYGVESLLPRGAPAWARGIGQVQDLLGDIHDLDVLDETVATDAADVDGWAAAAFRRRLDRRRRTRIERYRQRVEGRRGLLELWAAGLRQPRKVSLAAWAVRPVN